MCYARSITNAVPVNPIPDNNLTLIEFAGLSLYGSAMPKELTNMTLEELLAANKALVEIAVSMAHQTDMEAMMNSINQMIELSNSMVLLPDTLLQQS